MARTVRDNGIVVQQEAALDLTAASVDVAMVMNWPGTGAVVLDWLLKSDTVGVGAGTHTVTVEHGLDAAGVAASAAIAFIATTGAAAETVIEGDGLGVQPSGGSTAGTAMQLQNVESGTNITTGAIMDVLIRFLL